MASCNHLVHALMVHHVLALFCRLCACLVPALAHLWTNNLYILLVHSLMSIFHHFSSNLSKVWNSPIFSNFPLVVPYALSMAFHTFSHTDHMNMLCHIYQNPSSIPLNPLTNDLVSSIASMNDNLYHYHNDYQLRLCASSMHIHIL